MVSAHSSTLTTGMTADRTEWHAVKAPHWLRFLVTVNDTWDPNG